MRTLTARPLIRLPTEVAYAISVGTLFWMPDDFGRQLAEAIEKAETAIVYCKAGQEARHTLDRWRGYIEPVGEPALWARVDTLERANSDSRITALERALERFVASNSTTKTIFGFLGWVAALAVAWFK